MSKLRLALFAALLAVAGCMTPGAEPLPTTDGRIAPRAAIEAAAAAAPRGVPGIFAMQVTATGREGARVYLNSEADYRDQRNLTINIAPGAARELARRQGSEPDVFLRGRRIEVRGQARRTRIDFFDDSRRPTGLYYYQTHVPVEDADQIRIVD